MGVLGQFETTSVRVTSMEIRAATGTSRFLCLVYGLMKKLVVLLAMVPLFSLAAGPQRVVIKEKASRMERAPSDITNNLKNPPDWEMDYIVSAKDATRLKGLKLHVSILDKSGHLSNKYVSYISNGPGALRISVRPKQLKKPWRAHELGDVGSIMIVGERAKRSWSAQNHPKHP